MCVSHLFSISLGFLIFPLCHCLSSSSRFSCSPFFLLLLSLTSLPLSLMLPNSLIYVSPGLMWLIVCVCVCVRVQLRHGYGREGGREQESGNKADKERARKGGKKPFPTVILSTVAAAEFIHSNNHKQKMQALQDCGTFKILQLSYYTLFFKML